MNTRECIGTKLDIREFNEDDVPTDTMKINGVGNCTSD